MIVADLTDLELTVLGIIWKDGPSTAYALMRELAESPTSHYRAGAGSIYPLVARLKKRGYLNSEDGKQGRRPHRTYAVAPEGLAALRGWLTPPIPESAVALTFDPIRSRVFFLDALTPRQREAFAADAEHKLNKQLDSLREISRSLPAEDDTFTKLALDGALDVAKTRLTWMRRLRIHLAEDQCGP
jgi:DNA-binding PadR family transcriptional regulator